LGVQELVVEVMAEVLQEIIQALLVQLIQVGAVAVVALKLVLHHGELEVMVDQA
jgi:hypothetical protein